MAASSEMELQGAIGFNGSIQGGFLLHPGDKHIIYALGSTIIVKCLADNSQVFLYKDGHDDFVTALALSASGKYLASGQRTIQSGLAQIIIWDLETFTIARKLALHKGSVQDLHFSPREKYLLSLGGRDDNKLVVWDVSTGEPICGAPAAMDTAVTCRWLNTRDDSFVTAGNFNLRSWTFDADEKRIKPADCQLGQLKRAFNTVCTDPSDEFIYAGSKSGDIMKVSQDFKLMKDVGPKKRPFSLGVTCLIPARDGSSLVVGSGDGTLAVMNKNDLVVLRKTQVIGSITSIVLNAAGDHVFVATDKSNLYLVSLKTLDFEQRATGHPARVNGVAFPRGASDVFATCSYGDIRVWHSKTRNELLRIQVPNVDCTCVLFGEDGKSIISGWNDGKIRAFKPQSGALLWVINDAHRDAVTVLLTTRDNQSLLSAGVDGQVRIWSINAKTQKLIATMKEHKSRVNSLALNAQNTHVASASDDGSVIVWSLIKYQRSAAFFAQTQFKSVAFHPDGSQIITGGSDRKLTYWDVADANPIRILETGVNVIGSFAFDASGELFLSGNDARLVKLWHYDNGELLSAGYGHSATVTGVTFSPDQRLIVSVGEEGGIFVWTSPQVQATNFDDQLASLAISGPASAAAGAAAGGPASRSTARAGSSRRY